MTLQSLPATRLPQTRLPATRLSGTRLPGTRMLAAAMALAAILAPGLALAQHVCESSQTISCPEGQTYDTTTQACRPPLSS